HPRLREAAVGRSSELCGAAEGRLVATADVPQPQYFDRLLIHLIVEVISRSAKSDPPHELHAGVAGRSADTWLRRDEFKGPCKLRMQEIRCSCLVLVPPRRRSTNLARSVGRNA